MAEVSVRRTALLHRNPAPADRALRRGARRSFGSDASKARCAPPWFRPRPTGKRRAFGPNPGRAPGFAAETSIDHRGFKPKLRPARPKLRLHGADFAARRPPHERSCGRDGPAAYRSSPERVCPRVVPKGRADRDRNGQTPHARAPAGADVMPVGRVSAAPIARSLCRSGVRTTLRARGRLQAVAAGA